MIRRVLVANRGEIAVRVMRACRELSLETVAVCSEADRGARHARMADAVALLGAAPARESYLHIERVIDAARAHGADAVHPGYGFLSENAVFAAACADAGLTFIGPPADVIAAMGSKIGARAIMQRAGVPVVPGETPRDQSDEGVARAAQSIGFPVLVKASAGGGGKGMRAVHHEADLVEAIGAARREAEYAFGNGTLYVERLIQRPRHVEIQVFGDDHGQVVHLFERECSVQRRHQKVVEESPAPGLTPAIRARMGEAAVAAARASGYRNAGTVEFLLDGDGDEAPFYFLEMNTRLQVEHPVTEVVTGRDLVHAQLRVANGLPLPWRQDELTQRGHAIECRVYAEDPDREFLPQAGPLLRYREPVAPGIRVDSGVSAGDEITVHYDPMVAKVIAAADTREAAIARMRAALREFVVLGVHTNLAYLDRVLAHPAFAAGEIDTHFVAREQAALAVGAPDAALAMASAVAAHARTGGSAGGTMGTAPADTDPWSRIPRWGSL